MTETPRPLWIQSGCSAGWPGCQGHATLFSTPWVSCTCSIQIQTVRLLHGPLLPQHGAAGNEYASCSPSGDCSWSESKSPLAAKFPVTHSLSSCSDICISCLLVCKLILRRLWSIALSGPGLASLGNSLPLPHAVSAFQSVVAFSGGTTAVKENWLTAGTFARSCIFSPNYSTKKSIFNSFTLQAGYHRDHLYSLAQEQDDRLFHWQNASAVWHIYDTDGLIARIPLNVFLYFKDLRGCLEAWMRAFIQILYPYVQSYLQWLPKVRRASNMQWIHIFKARMSCRLRNNLLPALKKNADIKT